MQVSITHGPLHLCAFYDAALNYVAMEQHAVTETRV